MHIGGDHSAERELNLIATHQLSRGNCLPSSTALYRGIKGKTRLQSCQSSLCATLLIIGKRSIKKEKNSNDCSFVIFVQCEFKHNGSLEQPWNRRPKLGQCVAKRISRSIWHCIGSVLFKASTRLIIRESSQGDVLIRFCRLDSRFLDKAMRTHCFCGLHRHFLTGTRLDPLGRLSNMMVHASIEPSRTTICSVLLIGNKWSARRILYK